jgi:enterochelin esterase-like enzyme
MIGRAANFARGGRAGGQEVVAADPGPAVARRRGLCSATAAAGRAHTQISSPLPLNLIDDRRGNPENSRRASSLTSRSRNQRCCRCGSDAGVAKMGGACRTGLMRWGLAVTEISPRIARLLSDLPGGGSRVVDDFWREITVAGTPLVEAVENGSALVTFVWRGEAAHTATAWGVQVELRPIAGTDLWYGSQRLSTKLRTLYYLRHRGDDIPNDPRGVGPSHVDSLNRRSFRFPADRSDPDSRSYWASLLEMPAAPAEPWSYPRSAVPRGSLLQTSVHTVALGGQRRIGVYRPAAKDNGPVPLLIVFDGNESRTVLRIPTTLDNLIAAGYIPPMMALFVNAPSGARRFRELRPGPAIRHFVTRELLPWAQRRWSISNDPQHRVIAGSSLGGLVAAYIALVAPEKFGNVIAQSGSFWWPASSAAQPEWLTHAYATRPPLPLRFYLDVGDRETTSYHGDGLDQVTVVRRFRDVLLERGYQVTYIEYAGAHDYINWRRTFADGLLAVLGNHPVPRDRPHVQPGS